MVTTKHPLTGVELNHIEIERAALTFDEAVTAIVLRQRRVKFNSIAHLLGTNPARVGEVLRGEVHPRAAREALQLLTQ